MTIEVSFPNYLGNALSNLGRDEEAIIDFNKAIEIDPRDTMAYNNRGITFQKI